MGNFMEKISDMATDFAAECYENAPIIGITVGTVTLIGTTVWACKQTLKLPKTVEKAKKEIAEVKKNVPSTNKKEYTKALTKSYAHATLDVLKLYSGPIITGTLGLACIVAGTNEYYIRNAALTAEVTSLEAMFNRYRKNVRERYGEQVDQELRYGLKRETVTEKVVDEETGKKKTVKRDVLIMPDGNRFDNFSEYGRIWEDSNFNDETSRDYNLFFLKQCQSNANRILKKKGYLFLNEVYEMLGFPPTEAGQRVGWIRDPKHHITDKDYVGDNEVDFGITTVNRPVYEEYINGFQPYILLDFNVDGDICKDGLFVKNHKFRNC